MVIAILILKILLALITIGGGVAATSEAVGMYRDAKAQAEAVVPTGLDLVSVFAASANKAEARQHAREFAAICKRSADTLEYDLSRGDKACLKTGRDFATYRVNLVQLTTGGRLYSSIYPGFKSAVANHLDKAVGRNAGQLTPAEHAAWCAAMRELAAAATLAGEKL